MGRSGDLCVGRDVLGFSSRQKRSGETDVLGIHGDAVTPGRQVWGRQSATAASGTSPLPAWGRGRGEQASTALTPAQKVPPETPAEARPAASPKAAGTFCGDHPTQALPVLTILLVWLVLRASRRQAKHYFFAPHTHV